MARFKAQNALLKSVKDSISSFYLSRERYGPDADLAALRLALKENGRVSYVLREASQLFNKGPIPVALDIGGGTGALLKVLSEKVPIERKISSDIRISPGRIDGVEYVASDASQLTNSFARDSVDLILLLEVIEHLFDPDAVIKEIRKVLKPNGALLLTTPNLSSLTSRLALAWGFMPPSLEVSTERQFGRPFIDSGCPVGHIRVFTFRALREFMQFHGFEIIRMYTIPSPIFQPSTLPGIRYEPVLKPPEVGEPSESESSVRDLRSLAKIYNAIERLSVRLGRSLGTQIILTARKGENPRIAPP